MPKKLIFLAALVLVTVASVSANSTELIITVDTASLGSSTGSLDFNFGPGFLPPTQSASLEIENFESNGTLIPSPLLTGDVMGALPGTLTFDNGTGFNDYFQGIMFGTELSFDVFIYGPALSMPNGTSNSGSTFAFTIYSDSAGTYPALTTNPSGTNPGGFALETQVNLDGTTTTTNYSPDVSVEPEPASVVLFGTGLLGVGFVMRKRLFA